MSLPTISRLIVLPHLRPLLPTYSSVRYHSTSEIATGTSGGAGIGTKRFLIREEKEIQQGKEGQEGKGVESPFRPFIIPMGWQVEVESNNILLRRKFEEARVLMETQAQEKEVVERVESGKDMAEERTGEWVEGKKN